jgi:hypothetical protein
VVEFTLDDLKFIPDLIERDSVTAYNEEAAVATSRNRKSKK